MDLLKSALSISCGVINYLRIESGFKKAVFISTMFIKRKKLCDVICMIL